LQTREDTSWAWVTRTILFDRIITHEIARGTDTIINLAAGLDARPYRMDLPASLRWIEVDLPEILEYKSEILANEKPRCVLERVPLDLTDVDRRREFFASLQTKRSLVITEGLLIYLTREQVASLAEDLAQHFTHWTYDIASPGLLKMIRSEVGGPLDAV